MENIIKIKNYFIAIAVLFWEKIVSFYWPQYYDWLTQKLINYNPFMVLAAASSLALFFILIFYWARNR